MRERRVILCVGSQGTGKTTIAKAIYGVAMQRRQRVTILDPNHNLGGVFYAEPEELEEYLRARIELRDVDLLVLDDADRYVPKAAKKGAPWRAFWLTNRHIGVDIIVTARRVQNLPDELLSAVDFLYVCQLSAADVNGKKRLLEIAPGLVIPTEPFRFVCVQPKTADGCLVTGRTRPGGGFVLDS